VGDVGFVLWLIVLSAPVPIVGLIALLGAGLVAPRIRRHPASRIVALTLVLYIVLAAIILVAFVALTILSMSHGPTPPASVRSI
jgi:hypothetical protein